MLAFFQALLQLLDLIAPQISREQVFLADFLQISDATLSFADYMGLENYLRRKASAAVGELKSSTVKLIRGAMDLIFGFLGDELKNWVDGALERDQQSVIFQPVLYFSADLASFLFIKIILGKSSEFLPPSNKPKYKPMTKASYSLIAFFRSNTRELLDSLPATSCVNLH